MEKYGLIGYPLRHSFSIGYFNEKFRSEGINAEYVNFEIPNINDFMEVIEEMYLDSFLTIASIDSDELLNHAIQKLDVISEKYNVKFILSVSKDESKLTDIAKAKIVISL